MHHASARNMLPPELWSEIFDLALPDNWEDRQLGSRHLDIAQVCRTWRAIAYGTPCLWTTVHIDCYFTSPIKRAEAMRAELQRSGEAPLRLFIKVNAQKSSEWSKDVWSYICAQSHRWVHASLQGLSREAFDEIRGLKLVLLRSLQLKVRTEAFYRYADMLPPTFVFDSDECYTPDMALEIFDDVDAPKLAAFRFSYIGRVPASFSLVLPSSWKLNSLEFDLSEHIAHSSPPLSPRRTSGL
ncbi:hypothetical protein BD626DRAFT_563662 [Schizophyllum amplum]|uniref:F-box domain-containing protein n=1 Tax=Schizophyllum amplum TaxID=97359 RepID=A0A550CYU1_9AGAR|nr:hypothetical protein BD626DRAFT_563662 [Auriculariopsis ampla]